MKKSDLLALIAGDDIEPAFALADRAAGALDRDDLREELTLLRSQWEQAAKEERAGTSDPAFVQQQRNKVKRALISLAQGLPDDLPGTTPAPAPKKEPGMEEGKFKWRLFFGMLAVKVWIVYWILLHKGTGGFTSGEALATVALLLPAFAAYTAPMLADLLRHRGRPALPAEFQPRVRQSLRGFTWAFVLLYGLALHNVIGAKAAGRLADDPAANFENMTKWLAIVESGLGVYLGLIVGEFFKKGKTE